MQIKDYASRVPKTVAENIEFRRALLKEAARSKEFREALQLAFAASPSFWVNCVVWTHDPRRVKCPEFPFITWDYQDRAFRVLHDAILNQKDVVIEKARDMGASWICLLSFIHCFLYLPNTNYIFMSRVGELVESRGDMDAIFSKIDFTIKHLPKWMVPEDSIRRTNMHIENLANNATIDGTTTTSDATVGGRRTAAFYDEFSKVPNAEQVFNQSPALTGCRIFNGTPDGTANQFYRITKMEGFTPLRFDWWQHPLKAKGLYKDANGKKRSEWYDKEFKRLGNNKRAMAAQVDIDYAGASYQFFDPEEIARLITTYACDPYQIGEIDDGKFVKLPSGNLALWTHLNGHKPPPGEYVIGVDVAQGTGGPESTPSCSSVLNRTTGEKVAEFTTIHKTPTDYADAVMELGHWFYNAQIIWEYVGPGVTFGNRLVTLGYPNIYFRRKENKITKDVTKEPGFYPRPEATDAALEQYRSALSKGEFINRSAAALEECKKMVFTDDGHVKNSLSSRKDDPSGAKGNHADRVIADALANKAAKEFGPVEVTKQEQGPAEGSLLWRREQRENKAKQQQYWQTRRTV